MSSPDGFPGSSDQLYRQLFNSLSDAVFLVALDADGVPVRFAEVNEAACRLLGCTREELRQRSPQDVIAPGLNTITAPVRAVAKEVSEDGGSRFETVLTASDGSAIPVEICTSRVAVGTRAYNLSLARRQMVGAERRSKLGAASRRLYDIIEWLPDATFVLDQDRRIVAWNRSMERLTGVRKQDVLGMKDTHTLIFYGSPGKSLVDLLAEDPAELPERYRNVRRNDSIVSAEVFAPGLYAGLGAHVAVTAAILRDEHGAASGAIETLRDISERRDLEDRLAYIGSHDGLTGLYSRAHFEMALAKLDRDNSSEKAVIMCDVDGLKLVNDSLGHVAGDVMLRGAARAIRGCFREDDIVARIGGDEFAVIVPKCAAEAAQAACHRIAAAVEGYNEDHPGLPLSISTGYATGVATAGTDLYRMADDAMYREKLHRTKSARSAIIRALMKTLEARDIITERHSSRIEGLAAEMGSALGLPETRISELRLLARFHDIGKISVPDSILLKPGPLTADETSEMRRHCENGYQIALVSPDLLPIAGWILHHHERWDGAGYPPGLAGEEIPLECRIISIVDAFDAMTSDRPYRKAVTGKAALFELERCAGTQFDAQLVGLFEFLLRRVGLTDTAGARMDAAVARSETAR